MDHSGNPVIEIRNSSAPPTLLIEYLPPASDTTDFTSSRPFNTRVTSGIGRPSESWMVPVSVYPPVGTEGPPLVGPVSDRYPEDESPHPAANTQLTINR